MKIELITKSDLDDLTQLVQKMNEKIDGFSNPPTKFIRSKEVRQLLGGISESTLANLRNKGIIPFSFIERTYFYDAEGVIQAIKAHENTLLTTPKNGIFTGKSQPPPPLSLSFQPKSIHS